MNQCDAYRLHVIVASQHFQMSQCLARLIHVTCQSLHISKPDECFCVLVKSVRDRELLDRLRPLSRQRKYPTQEIMADPEVGIASRNRSQFVTCTIKVAREIIAVASQSRSYH